MLLHLTAQRAPPLRLTSRLIVEAGRFKVRAIERKDILVNRT